MLAISSHQKPLLRELAPWIVPRDQRETDWPIDPLSHFFENEYNVCLFSCSNIIYEKKKTKAICKKLTHYSRSGIWGKLNLYSVITVFWFALYSFPNTLFTFLTVTELKYTYNYPCTPKDSLQWVNRQLWVHLWKSDCFFYCASLYIYLHWLFVIGISGICVSLLQSSHLVLSFPR